MTLIEVSSSSMPTSVSDHITSFACRKDDIFAAQHVAKDNTCLVFFVVKMIVMMIVLNQFLPLVLSWLTIGCLLKKVNKPACDL